MRRAECRVRPIQTSSTRWSVSHCRALRESGVIASTREPANPVTDVNRPAINHGGGAFRIEQNPLELELRFQACSPSSAGRALVMASSGEDRPHWSPSWIRSSGATGASAIASFRLGLEIRLPLLSKGPEQQPTHGDQRNSHEGRSHDQQRCAGTAFLRWFHRPEFAVVGVAGGFSCCVFLARFSASLIRLIVRCFLPVRGSPGRRCRY